MNELNWSTWQNPDFIPHSGGITSEEPESSPKNHPYDDLDVERLNAVGDSYKVTICPYGFKIHFNDKAIGEVGNPNGAGSYLTGHDYRNLFKQAIDLVEAHKRKLQLEKNARQPIAPATSDVAKYNGKTPSTSDSRIGFSPAAPEVERYEDSPFQNVADMSFDLKHETRFNSAHPSPNGQLLSDETLENIYNKIDDSKD